jgi:hypothetical protein
MRQNGFPRRHSELENSTRELTTLRMKDSQEASWLNGPWWGPNDLRSVNVD